jgi:hypothetical protein
MNISNIIKLFPLTFFLILSFACKGWKMTDKAIPLPPVKNVPESTWKRLSEKRTYFGHQSVGFNIVEGLKDVIKENPQIKLNIVETNDPTMFGIPIFAHSCNGKNHYPISKVDAFVESMERGIGNNADYAFFKLCFVDITANTDVQKVFTYYREKMEKLKDQYPKTIFIHVTVPLTTVQRGPKAFIKKIIGRPIDGYADNIKRNEFNSLLRKEYEGKAPILDLAKIESITSNGKSVAFTKDGKSFYAMNPEYTHDGGHLNETGRKVVAQSLLILLANLIEQKY